MENSQINSYSIRIIRCSDTDRYRTREYEMLSWNTEFECFSSRSSIFSYFFIFSCFLFFIFFCTIIISLNLNRTRHWSYIDLSWVYNITISTRDSGSCDYIYADCTTCSIYLFIFFCRSIESYFCTFFTSDKCNILIL